MANSRHCYPFCPPNLDRMLASTHYLFFILILLFFPKFLLPYCYAKKPYALI